MTGRSATGDEFVIRGCRFPHALRYDVKYHMWYMPLEGGLIRFGMTSVGPALASNQIFAFTPKRVGREVEKDRSCATIESSKWVGPARAAFDGVVVEINEHLVENPGLLVKDPYGAGWMIVAQAAHADPIAHLPTGDRAREAYEHWMNENNFPGCEPPA